ncbi:MAG: prepilin-type N-terminal cleavage/methylation domain-containing protein [Anaplasmataceae bacterium]|nr:prepilin-type N-terminal cleavage/methylation domain-containing protein [Anaplasmataceae bacterium]
MATFSSRDNRRGLSLIEVIIALAMISMLFGAIYLSYFSILDVVSSSEYRAQASALLSQEIEVIRNIPFDDVGVVGGIPAGVIPASKNVTGNDGNIYSLSFTIRNIDDPFDGTIGGTPNDTAPADYKLVEIEVDCLTCSRFVPISITTTVAPKSLESASSDGSLFINVFDASAQGVSGATVHVINSTTIPTIDLLDTTNASGVLQLVGVPTSTQGYFIQVTKNGYTTERTYAIGDSQNPSPLPQYTHATVQAQTLTTASFSIDRLSTFEIITSDEICQPIINQDFTLQGTKTIGTPDVYKNNYSSSTDGGGNLSWSNIEWDTYTIEHNTGGYDIAGITTPTTLLVNPNSSTSVRYVLKNANPSSLLVSARDAVSGLQIPSSSITISRSGFSATSTTARATWSETSWSGGTYSSESGGVDLSNASHLRLLLNASGTYDPFVDHWLISNTFDTGGPTSTFYTLSWNPTTQPPETGVASLKFQLASNNDNATWNFIGPDGTAGSYYTTPGNSIHSSHNGHRYLRYKVYLSTTDENFSPQLDDLSITFFGPCVPIGQSLFQNLANSTYDVTVSAPGYIIATTTATVSGSWQSVDLNLVSL